MSNLALVDKDDFVEINDDRHLLKVKVKHLAAEALIIRKEESLHHGTKKWGLQHHRKTILRTAARRAQLAYAIIRNKTRESTVPKYGSKLASIEQFLDEAAVSKMVKKYGDLNIDYRVSGWFG
jgi:hypothetical protein